MAFRVKQLNNECRSRAFAVKQLENRCPSMAFAVKQLKDVYWFMLFDVNNWKMAASPWLSLSLLALFLHDYRHWTCLHFSKMFFRNSVPWLLGWFVTPFWIKMAPTSCYRMLPFWILFLILAAPDFGIWGAPFWLPFCVLYILSVTGRHRKYSFSAPESAKHLQNNHTRTLLFSDVGGARRNL